LFDANVFDDSVVGTMCFILMSHAYASVL